MVGRAPAKSLASRRSRLRAAEFQRVFQERGRSVEGRNFVALWRGCHGQGGGVGFAVSRRIGGAVARNLARRRLREAYRRAVIEPTIDANIVFVARPGVMTCEFAELMRDMERTVSSLRRRMAGERAGSVRMK